MKWQTMKQLEQRFDCTSGKIYNHCLDGDEIRSGLYVHRRRVTDEDRARRDDVSPQHVWLYCTSTAPPEMHRCCDVCGDPVTPRRHVVFKDQVACVPCHRSAFIEHDVDARRALGVG